MWVSIKYIDTHHAKIQNFYLGYVDPSLCNFLALAARGKYCEWPNDEQSEIQVISNKTSLKFEVDHLLPKSVTVEIVQWSLDLCKGSFIVSRDQGFE